MKARKTTFASFVRELEAEATAEGPDAERELQAFQEHFRQEREKALSGARRRAANRRRPRRG